MELEKKTIPNPKLNIINKAREVIRGNRNLSIEKLKQLCKQLEKLDQFAYATEILLIIVKEEENAGHTFSLKNFQTLAKYIYKDHSLPSSFKFDKALNELKTHEDLFVTGKCESLGLAGAIYKRKWQFDHQSRNLVLSQHHYKRGFEQWKYFITEQMADRSCDKECNDDGYTAINYAHISELIAVDKLEEFSEMTGLTSDIIKNLNEAKETREYILDQFIKDVNNPNPELKQNVNDNSWIIATVAEAWFGLHKYDIALIFIKQYISLPGLNQWEIRSFSQQIFSLAYLQTYQKKFYETKVKNKIPGYEQLEALAGQISEKRMNACLSVFMGKRVSGEKKDVSIEIKKDGKVGLALSGGGFRASLFHIGVLASLAENDQLKNVELISCVSGGSIIGAYYYLKLKKVLEENTDDNIDKSHYLQIVKEIEKDFLQGVQNNLRMRIFSNLFLNFRMLWDKNYSRSHRIGELYETYFYKTLTGKDKLYMSDLFINPKLEEGENFSFTTDNWKRNNKIPQLVLNATTVNTGHNWQFTASWMGEPPGNIQTDIDVKPRLRRMYYEEAPEKYKKFRVGYAVGASACVPVMFHPMPLPDLFPGIDLQLIDGGLHDNQGIAALIEAECKNMIISDASGQMATNDVATHNAAAVFYRADTILQERIRELQFMDIKERSYTTQLNSLITVHLKNGLKAYPVSWKYCIDPERSILYEDENYMIEDLLKYGVLRDVQVLLSEIRTDLDSFHDIEAYALMYSGYTQTNYEFNKKGNENIEGYDWDFLKIQEYLTIPAKADKIKKILISGRKLAFKVLDVSKPAKIAMIILGVLASIPLVWLVYKFYDTPIYKTEVTVKVIFGFILVGILGYVFKSLAKFINYKSTIAKYLALVFVMIAGFIVSNIYLFFFNGIYNNA
nr:patatin-like phospholipase family protein [Solirubrobacterales bacterium]